MKNDHPEDDEAEETITVDQNPGNPIGFEKIRNLIADQLHHMAEAMGENASDPEAQPEAAQENKVSGWLAHSAEYVRQFDPEAANVSVREYIGENPGRCLLIAAGVGLIAGAFLRRR